MGHPLTPDLSKLTTDEIVKKHGDLIGRLSAAYRMGSGDMVYQLQMLLEDYQNELNLRNQKALADMEKNSKQFKNIIDIS